MQQLLTYETAREEEEEEQEQEVKGQHCTSLCQRASKAVCVCGYRGANHGIRSMLKLDQFFDDNDGNIQE